MADPIRPKDLPAAPSVPTSASIMVDNGVTVDKATPIQVVDAAIPLASQADAEAGVDNTKRVTALRVKQAIDARGFDSAIAGKEPLVTPGTSAQYYRGDKTFQTLDKTVIGLGNVNNTADMDKPVSTAVQAALDSIPSAATKVNATAVGIPATDANMGTTPGTILSDNGTAKQWFQESEAAIDVVRGVAFQGPTSDAAAVAFPASVDVVKTSGHTANGDGGDAEYTAIPDVPAHTGYFTDANGRHFAISKRTVRLSQFGALPSVADNSAAISAALFYLNDIGGGCFEIDHEGYYDVAATALLASMTTHIRAENKAGGIIRAAPGLTSSVMRFNGPVGAINGGMLTLHDLKIDNSQGSTPAPGGYCTGLTLNDLEQVISNGFECFGGDQPVNVNADSGISTVRVRTMILNDCIIRGQGDAAIYPSWDNSGDIDGYLEVNGGTFSRNQQVLAAKRNLKDVVWRGGLLLENRGGLTTQWVDNGGWVHPARNLDIDGVLIRKTLANAIQMKGDGRLKVTNSRIIDLGYEYGGTGNVGANARAVVLQGIQRAYIRNLHFEMMDWASAQEYAFSLLNDTTSGTYTTGNHDIDGCSYRNWYRIAIGGDGNPSRWGRENYPSAAPAVASSQHASSRMDYSLAGDSRRYTRIGQTAARETFDTHRLPITVDLTSLGTLAAGSQTAVQSAAVTGLTASDNVHLARLSANLANSPAILISCRTTTDAVQYVIRNSGASGFDFTSQSIRLSF